MASWSWPASKVKRVIDGDTIDMLVTRDLGFGGTATYPVRVRLNRVNAPKAASARGRAARDRVTALLTGPVDLVTVKPYKYGGPEDQRGEYMAEITLPDGRNLSDVLVAEGLAVPWSGQGARPADD
jgi:endonuclease YncB( thermonuclease family)